MGTDNIRHRRKVKKLALLARDRAKIEPYDRVLIVCEGEKTEPLYFQDLINYHRISSVNVEITGDCGSDPSSILKHAKTRFKEERDCGNPFDKVFCVFDKDGHAMYAETIRNIENIKQKKVFTATNSVPSFEYWLLLHFEYNSKPYNALKGNSPGNQVLKELLKHFPKYQKKDAKIYTTLGEERLATAMKNAEKSLQEANRNGSDNPSTKVQDLVDYLRKIKD